MVFGGCFRERRGSCQGGVFVRRSSVDLVKGDLVDGVVVVMLFLLGILDIFASCCLLAAIMYCTYLCTTSSTFNVGEPGGEGGIFRSSPHLRYWKVFHMRQDPIHVRTIQMYLLL